MKNFGFSAKKASLVVDAFFFLFFLTFIYSHITGFFEYRKWSLLAFALSETITIFFFIFRSKPQIVSEEPIDYVIAILGTFAALLFRPFVGRQLFLGDTLVLLGMGLQIASLLSLNSSFGVVPANRGVKTLGMYRFIRHPMYASYIILYLGYVINNQTATNIGIFLCAVTLQVLRTQSEEKLLSKDSLYREYQKKVSWKLIPGAF